MQLVLTRIETLVGKVLSRSIPAIELLQEQSRCGCHRLAGSDGFLLLVVVLAKESVFLDKPEDHLSKKLPQKWPSFLRDPVLPAESAALIHPNVQASMPQELLVVLEVAQGAGLGRSVLVGWPRAPFNDIEVNIRHLDRRNDGLTTD